MKTYTIKTNNPIANDGMNVIVCADGRDPLYALAFPVEDDTDDGVWLQFDGHSVQVQLRAEEDKWVEIDLHDPVIALQVLRRHDAVKGPTTEAYLKRLVLTELLLDDNDALDRRAVGLLKLLKTLDETAEEAACTTTD